MWFCRPSGNALRSTRFLGLLVKRHHALRIHGQIADTVFTRRMRGHEFHRLAAADLPHFLPQGNRGARIVTGAVTEIPACCMS